MHQRENVFENKHISPREFPKETVGSIAGLKRLKKRRIFDKDFKGNIHALRALDFPKGSRHNLSSWKQFKVTCRMNAL